MRAGLEFEALVVELFEGFENLRDLGAVGPAVELEDREAVGDGDFGEGVVADEPVVDEFLICVRDLDGVEVGGDVGAFVAVIFVIVVVIIFELGAGGFG